VVGAWAPGEISQVAKFIKNGLHSFISRDENGDFIFLLTSIMEAAFMTVQAQRAQIVMEKLRDEVESVRQLQEAVCRGIYRCRRATRSWLATNRRRSACWETGRW
jgi:phosphoserine phosphatase RsbU/P